MRFDRTFYGIQELTDEDRQYAGSRFADVCKALHDNAYYLSWGADNEPPLPVYAVTLRHVLCGLPRPSRWRFRQAARRAIDSAADLRWGPDGRGYRRLLHPNGVCLTGQWIIDQTPPGTAYTGHFRAGSKALIVARYSTCCSETRRGRYRSLSMVGKLYPTENPDHEDLLRTANFITQEDLGGDRSKYIADAKLRNAPNTSPWRRGLGFPILLLTGLVFRLTDLQPTHRQLYEVAELGKPAEVPTSCPKFMQLTVADGHRAVEGDDLDFRDEILSYFHDNNDGNQESDRPKLTFNIEVTDEGKTRGLLIQRRKFGTWNRIGRIEFDRAVASYNGDFVLHFHHPPWRHDRNDPATIARPR